MCPLLSRVRLFGTSWTVACQAPLSMGFSRHAYWSGLPCSGPGIEPGSPALQVDSLLAEPPGKPVLIIRDYDYSTDLEVKTHGCSFF